MRSSTDSYWTRCYETGRDFQLVSSGSISKFLSFVEATEVKRCLDIGCGTGQLTRELYHRGFQVIGIDASAKAVDIARSLTTASQRRLTYLHFNIEDDDVSDLPYTSFGLVTCKLVYAFIVNRQAFLKRVMQLLAPDGVFVLVTPLPEDVSAEKRSISVSHDEVGKLSRAFEQVAVYKHQGLIYFVGRHRVKSRLAA